MPSADIAPKGKHFYMHESQFRTWQPGRYWYGTNSFATEPALPPKWTLTNWNAGFPATPNFATGIGFKGSPQLFSKSLHDSEIKFTVGQKLVFKPASPAAVGPAPSSSSRKTPPTSWPALSSPSSVKSSSG